MLNVNGKCSVHKVENRGNFVTATLRVGKKNSTGEWESEFFNAKFVGKCKNQAANLSDKDKITLVNAGLENRKVNDKSYISIVVFDFSEDEPKGDAYEPSAYPFPDTDDELPIF